MLREKPALGNFHVRRSSFLYPHSTGEYPPVALDYLSDTSRWADPRAPDRQNVAQIANSCDCRRSFGPLRLYTSGSR